jgi:hypothetical protein
MITSKNGEWRRCQVEVLIRPAPRRNQAKSVWISVEHRDDFIADSLGGSRFRQFAPSAVIRTHAPLFIPARARIDKQLRYLPVLDSEFFRLFVMLGFHIGTILMFFFAVLTSAIFPLVIST